MADYLGLETTGHLLLEDGTGGVLVEPSVYNDSGSGTVTASGSGTESYGGAPVTYTDSRTATVTASGTGVEDYIAPAFRSAGPLSAPAGTTTVSYPSGVVSGDVLLMQALVYGLEVDTGMATPSGWTKLLGPVAL